LTCIEVEYRIADDKKGGMYMSKKNKKAAAQTVVNSNDTSKTVADNANKETK
jgi:hypothetical protein